MFRVVRSTKRRKYLDENAAAVQFNLEPQELARLAEKIPSGAAAGERSPEPAMRRVNL